MELSPQWCGPIVWSNTRQGCSGREIKQNYNRSCVNTIRIYNLMINRECDFDKGLHPIHYNIDVTLMTGCKPVQGCEVLLLVTCIDSMHLTAIIVKYERHWFR
jgi:hypothetical protein